MKTLRISSDLRIPLDAVTQTFAILAIRGAGKTYTASVICEEMVKAGAHVVVVDPIGVWWGLRSSADGKSAGLPIVVLGGDHGDVPLEHTAGEIVADFVIGERQSVVLDLSLMRKGQQVQFMTDFAETLYRRNRNPLHMFLDEADAFAPQRPMRGQERMLGALEDIVRRGRARGIGVTLITQRTAVLNKDVLTQVEVLIAMRTIGPHDRKAIDAWVESHGTPEQRDRLMESLASLPTGTAWFWSPGWLDTFVRIAIRKRETFDSSATPKTGARHVEPRKMAEVDLAVLSKRMAATIEKQKANDPRELRRQVAELQRELQRKQTTAAPREKIKRVEVPIFSEGHLSRLERLVEKAEGITLSVHSDLKGKMEQLRDIQKRSASPALQVDIRPRSVVTPPAVLSKEAPGIRSGERRILQTMAMRHPTKLTRAQLGTLSGFTPSGGTFGTYFGSLKRRGFLTESASGDVAITEEGLLDLGSNVPPAPTTTEEILDLWRKALRAGEWIMLHELIKAYPQGLSREDLGKRSGFTHTGGTFGTYLGVLRRNGLIEVDGDTVRASETVFLA